MQIVQCYRPVCRERWAFYVVIKRHFLHLYAMLMEQAAAVLNMMEGFLGAETFRDGVRVRIFSHWSCCSWAPAGMGNGGHLPLPSLHWKYCKVFCALVVTVKRSEDEIFMHHFHNLSSASRGFTGDPSLDPAAKLSSPDP